MVMEENINKIKAAVEDKKSREEAATQKSPVAIFTMHVDAIKALADDTNEIFSEISKDKAIDIAIASLFGKNPCHNINERLLAKNVVDTDGKPIQIKLPVLDEYIKEVFRHLHKADRKRVEEYLKALESLKTGEQSMRITEERRPGLFSRMI